MPITVRHDVPSRIIGELSTIVGQREREEEERRRQEDLAFQLAQIIQQRRDRQSQLDLDYARLDQQGSQFDRNLAAEQQNQGLNRALSLAESQRQAAQFAVNDQFRRDALDEQLAARAYENQSGREFDLVQEQLDAQNQARLQQQRALDQQANTELQGESQARNKLFGDIPQEVREGLQRGFLRYTPEQKTELRQLDAAVNKLAGDRSMTPMQRMQGQRMLAEKRRSILTSPVEVPWDELPPEPYEQFNAEAPMFTDPETGLKSRFTKDRNGVWRPVPETPAEKAKREADAAASEERREREKDSRAQKRMAYDRSVILWKASEPQRDEEEKFAEYQARRKVWIASMPPLPNFDEDTGATVASTEEPIAPQAEPLNFTAGAEADAAFDAGLIEPNTPVAVGGKWFTFDENGLAQPLQ